MKRIHIVTIAALLSICAMAIDFRTERIFITTQASEYAPGDSIDVSGIVLSSDSAFFPYSRYLYMEVMNHNDSVLLRQKLSCDSRGKFHHRFQADLLWQPDIYYIRAYTRLMQNFNTQTFPIVPVQIGKRIIQPEFKVSDLKCSFHPEGGTLLSNALQNITVSLTDLHGFPLSLPYYITCEEDTLCRQQTTRSGLQRIQLYMQKGKKYVLHTQAEGKAYQFPLPDTKKGIALQAVANHSRVSYHILASTPMDLADYHLYAYHQDWGMNKIALLNSSGIINMEGISSGILSLFLLDDKNGIVSQRSLWLEGKRDKPVLEDMARKYTPGEGIPLTGLFSQDTTKQVFCRIMKANYWCAPHAESALTWLCDLSSPLAFPMHYYQESVADRRIDLEAWMATTDFIRFDVASALSTGFSYQYPLEQYLALEGHVETRGGNPVKQSMVIAYHTDNGYTYQAESDDEGKFHIPVDDFKDGDSFFLQTYTGRKKNQTDFFKYKMKDDVFPAVTNPFHVRKEQALNDAEVEIGYSSESAYGLDKNNLLPEVKVKAKVRADQYIPTKRFYKTNYIDAMHIKEKNYTQMEDVIHAIPVLNLRKNSSGENDIPGMIFAPKKQYILTTTRGNSILGKKGETLEVKVLLDNIQVDIDEVINLSPFEIESVEYLTAREALAVTYGAINGALVVKTKKSDSSREEVKSKGIIYTPMGLANYGSPGQDFRLKAPQERGKYKVLVDVVSGDRNIESYEIPIEVK